MYYARNLESRSRPYNGDTYKTAFRKDDVGFNGFKYFSGFGVAFYDSERVAEIFGIEISS